MRSLQPFVERGTLSNYLISSIFLRMTFALVIFRVGTVLFLFKLLRPAIPIVRSIWLMNDMRHLPTGTRNMMVSADSTNSGSVAQELEP